MQPLHSAIIAQLKPRTYTDWQHAGVIIERQQAILDTIPQGNFICLDKAIELLSQPEIITRSVADYRRSLRTLVRGLFKQTFTTSEFIDQMQSLIRRNITQAWYLGAKECGIKPDELTERELTALADKINTQYLYIPGFADAIAQAEKIQPMFDRADLWVNQYESARVTGAAMACGDKKKVWRLNPAKESCKTCIALNGKVKRYSYWIAHVLPRNAPNGSLLCGGWKCGCNLEDTDEPVSKGKLPMGL